MDENTRRAAENTRMAVDTIRRREARVRREVNLIMGMDWVVRHDFMNRCKRHGRLVKKWARVAVAMGPAQYLHGKSKLSPSHGVIVLGDRQKVQVKICKFFNPNCMCSAV